jgi:hypothetical protein
MFLHNEKVAGAKHPQIAHKATNGLDRMYGEYFRVNAVVCEPLGGVQNFTGYGATCEDYHWATWAENTWLPKHKWIVLCPEDWLFVPSKAQICWTVKTQSSHQGFSRLDRIARAQHSHPRHCSHHRYIIHPMMCWAVHAVGVAPTDSHDEHRKTHVAQIIANLLKAPQGSEGCN